MQHLLNMTANTSGGEGRKEQVEDKWATS